MSVGGCYIIKADINFNRRGAQKKGKWQEEIEDKKSNFVFNIKKRTSIWDKLSTREQRSHSAKPSLFHVFLCKTVIQWPQESSGRWCYSLSLSKVRANLASAVLVKWATLFSMNSLSYAQSPSCSFALSEIVCANPRHKFLLRHTRFIFYIPAITSCLLKGSHVLFLGVYSVLISASYSVRHDNHPYACRFFILVNEGQQPRDFCPRLHRLNIYEPRFDMHCPEQSAVWTLRSLFLCCETNERPDHIGDQSLNNFIICTTMHQPPSISLGGERWHSNNHLSKSPLLWSSRKESKEKKWKM